jgi:plasmid stabilization system protein ParE
MRLVYTKPVRSRILEIHQYVAEAASEEHANDLIRILFDKADRLLVHPLLGSPVPELASLNKGHRGLVLGRYKIIYNVTRDEVRITDFFDTRQHPSRMRG